MPVEMNVPMPLNVNAEYPQEILLSIERILYQRK
jgi:hypothetical protein